MYKPKYLYKMKLRQNRYKTTGIKRLIPNQPIESKYINLTIYWMPSHTDSNPKKREIAPEWMEPWHVAGNNMADKLAGAATDMNAIPETEANKIIQIYVGVRNKAV